MKPTITQATPAFISHSDETGSDYTVYMDTPKAPGPWDAILVMDGDFFFDPAVAAARTLREEGRIPHAAVIGVGYGVGFGKPGNHRGRDYTPTASAEEPTSGGADRFLAYLTDSLWPELTRRHPLREDRRVLAGHSLGSLLVLHALFQPVPFFNRALASAPSIWWDDRSLLDGVRGLRDRQAHLDARLYLGVGADDSPSMLEDMGLLEGLLKKRPFAGLTVSSARFPGFDHYNVVGHSVCAGLATLLD
jgi:hypothetical protein